MSGVLTSPIASAPARRSRLLPLRPPASLALALALLALSVAALVLLAEQLVTHWTDGLLFLGWLLLWLEIFAATAVFDAWRRLHHPARRPVDPGMPNAVPHDAALSPAPSVARYGDSTPYF